MSPLRTFHELSTRVFDTLLSTIAIIFLAPVLASLAVAISLDSRGPVVFTQARLGKRGNHFKMYKFRSMIENAENIGTGLFNYRDDPRVTRVGHFMRKTSLDELPQLLNILKGDMSFVGPRPPLTYELGNYSQFTERLKKRFAVRPGMTGYAQMSGRNELSWDQKIQYDLQYIDSFYKWGLLLNLTILVLTFFVVILMKGSYELKENAQADARRVDKAANE